MTSHDWTRDLKDIYNIINKKSLTLEPPNIKDEDIIKAFIIGYIDGDGTICFIGKNKYLKIGIVGTKSFLTWIKSYFDKWIPNTKAKKQIGPNTYSPNIYEYVVYGKRAKELILLLKSVEVDKMKRKWDKITEETPILLSIKK